MKNELKPILLSQIATLKEAGFELIQGGDAAKANGDYFAIFERRNSNGISDYRILCPTFLRGNLGISQVRGGLSY